MKSYASGGGPTYVRKELSVPRQRVNAMGYWRTAG
ncbi:siderophore-interacting protein [Streptomyces sp. S1D4-23]|nr:siderophore-interacting protein [Streptomyces sp. RLB3-6]QDO09585.1 siderophore-interacting protein [Streptomyces sp. S1D4-23]